MLLKISYGLSGLLLAAVVWWGWGWLREPVEQVVLSIQAPRETELGLPVYAQFIVTQTVQLSLPAVVSRLVVPLAVPDAQAPAVIRLKRYDQTVQEWRLGEVVSGASVGDVVDVELALRPPRLLDEGLALVFDGSEIPHAERQRAPRLMIETAGERYPAGNFRIAENGKTGDVGVTVYQLETRWHMLASHWWVYPYEGAWAIGVTAVAVALLGALPSVLVRTVGVR